MLQLSLSRCNDTYPQGGKHLHSSAHIDPTIPPIQEHDVQANVSMRTKKQLGFPDWRLGMKIMVEEQGGWSSGVPMCG